MEGTTARLCLFLLLNQLLVCATDGDGDISTMQMNPPSSDLDTTIEPLNSNTDGTDFFDINGTRADCLIDTEMGLIAVGSAGGLIVCLLVTTVVLACQVCHLQKRVYLRTSRSKTNLVGASSHWDTEQSEAGGVVGPCDSNVVLEEVTTEGETQQQGGPSQIEETGTGLEEDEGAVAMALLPKEKPWQTPISISSSSSRDYGLELPRDLEDMPLVV